MPQCDIDPNAACRSHKEHAVLKGKITGTLEAGFVVGQPFIHKGFLSSEAGQKSQVEIQREAGFSPMKNGDTPDNAELPTALLAEPLQFQRKPCQFVHATRIF